MVEEKEKMNEVTSQEKSNVLLEKANILFDNAELEPTRTGEPQKKTIFISCIAHDNEEELKEGQENGPPPSIKDLNHLHTSKKNFEKEFEPSTTTSLPKLNDDDDNKRRFHLLEDPCISEFLKARSLKHARFNRNESSRSNLIGTSSSFSKSWGTIIGGKHHKVIPCPSGENQSLNRVQELRHEMPRGITKSLTEKFLKRKLSNDVLDSVYKCVEDFMSTALDDVGAYAQHAHRKRILVQDVEILLRRQRQVDPKRTSLASLARQYLCLEDVTQLLEIASQTSTASTKTNSST